MKLKDYLNLKIKKNIFKKEWLKIEKTGARSSTYGKLDMEDQIDDGDIGFFNASLRRGLDKIDPSKKVIRNKKNGKLWFGYNIHSSDLIKNVMLQHLSI